MAVWRVNVRARINKCFQTRPTPANNRPIEAAGKSRLSTGYLPVTDFNEYLCGVTKNQQRRIVGLPPSIGLPLSYGICLLLLYPFFIQLYSRLFHEGQQPVLGAYWTRMQFIFSGPGLSYFGLVIMRVYKPVPRGRKILGLCLFLIGFGWLFEILESMSLNKILS